jgi:hypothetical protein
MQIALLVLLAALLFASAWAIVAKPRVIYGVLTIAEIALFAWQARDFRQASLVAQIKLGTFEDYTIETGTPGDHSIRIRELPLVNGLQVRPIPKAGAEPPNRFELQACEWSVEGYNFALATGPAEGAVHEFTSDSWGRGGGKSFVLSYRVTDRSRPILDRIAVLRAQPPYDRYHETLIAEGVARMLMFFSGLLAGVGLAGLASQAIRHLRRRRPHGQKPPVSA